MNITGIDNNWLKFLNAEIEKPYMVKLRQFLVNEKKAGKTIYPQSEDVFNALRLTPFDNVKVVILGQDPYHGPGQAHGLSFSVKANCKIPPSLRNIFKEINQELKIPMPTQGNLESWADQGVLLLNTVLTVEAGKAGSHRGQGWETLTDRLIAKLQSESENLVFLLWGKDAISKAPSIEASKHLILTSPHPSPLSAHRGFLGNRHFSFTNNYLKEEGIPPINWEIPDAQSLLF